MHLWLILALVAPGIFTIVNFIDKYVVENKVKDYKGIPVYSAVVGLISGILFWFIFGKPVLPLFDSSIVILTGILTIWGYAFYFKALSSSQTSYVIGLFQMIPVITLILSFLFLNETITLFQFLGFIVILSSVFLLSFKKEKKKFKIEPSFYWILIADVFFAASNVIIKFAITANSFTKIVSYESWGIAIGGLILYIIFPTVRNAFLETTRSVGQKVLSIMFLNEFILIIAKAVTFLAISLGSVSLVSVLTGTQVFYGLIFGFCLTLVAPKIFNEDTKRKDLLKKLALMVVLFLGILLVR